MHEKLKFSWGHIIAFLGLIIVSYITFVGLTYMTAGNFNIAIIGMAVTDIVFIIFFIGAQQMKASGYKVSKKIVWERIFVFGSPVVFVAGMIAMSHFWTVHSQNDEIVKTFTSSINDAKQLFADYEAYATNRIDNYDKALSRIIASGTDTVHMAEIDAAKADLQKENLVDILRLQLLSDNYNELKKNAIEWIDNSSQGVSTWNVFLLGNTREIKEALTNWETELRNFSKRKMSNETLITDVEEFTSSGVKSSLEGIEILNETFSQQHFPTLYAFIFGIILYLMLIFPYLIQERHPKSWYRLIGTESSRRQRKPEEIEVREFSETEKPIDHKKEKSKKQTPKNKEIDNEDFSTF